MYMHTQCHALSTLINALLYNHVAHIALRRLILQIVKAYHYCGSLLNAGMIYVDLSLEYF